MSRGVNRVTLLGNVGNDPEIRATSGGSRVAKLSLATNRTWSDRAGAKQEKTDWHRVTFFGKTVDVVEQYVKKGDRIYVEGRIEYSQTESPAGGVKYWTDIIASELVMLGVGKGDTSEVDDSDLPPMAKASAKAADPDSDLPF